MRISVVQRDFPIGDIDGNVRRILDAAQTCAEQGADLALYPELTLCGYPPEDLLIRPGFLAACEAALADLAQRLPRGNFLIGHPEQRDGLLYNALSWFSGGQRRATYLKQALPNYAVFDEKRYFAAGREAAVIEVAGVKVGLLVCEDLWEPGPTARACDSGAELIVVSNASPFHDAKAAHRRELLQRRHAECGLPIVYANTVGGQDELVFDGGSLAISAAAEITALPHFTEGEFVLDFDPAQGRFHAPAGVQDETDPLVLVYQAIVLGTRDYVRKNGFDRVLLGLSGGIDSALCLAICVDALGAEQVLAVALPSRYSAALSLELAREQTQLLGVDLLEMPIGPSVEALEASLRGVGIDPGGLTEQNLQARARGILLMGISNDTGRMLITTGNKSELAVGYCTLYGDMCGGFAPIKDCVKGRVYELARLRNRCSPAIPEGVIERAPSAELAPDQKDEDSLPPYALLDEIVQRYVEADESVEEMIAAGLPSEAVHQVARLVLVNEYKRRQSAPGVRVTPRAFGRDRRYPITSGWKP